MAAPRGPPLSIVEGQVCERCCSALQTAYSWPGRNVSRCDKLSDLLVSAQSKGCELCRLLYQHMIYNTSDLEELEGPIEITWLVFDAESHPALIVSGGVAPVFLSSEYPSSEEGNYQVLKTLEGSSYQPLITTIKEWGQTCLDQHKNCQQQGLYTMPTRVIDVGIEQQHPDKWTVRLIETLPAQTDRYIALSYCWGSKGNNVRTTRSTYSQMMHGFSSDTLPRTIQDAIKVTRSLGIRYLWVDALCIIQFEYPGDPGSDWATEAGKMSTYYQNAFYTIGASSSRDCDDGFLKARPAHVDPPTHGVTLSYHTDSGQQEHMYILPTKPMRSVCVDNSPLLRRGWCVQERAFSTRCLYFARDSLVWECAQHRALEWEPNWNSDDQKREQWEVWTTPKGNDNLMKQGTLMTIPKDELIAEAWMGMLIQYSRAEFTFLSDKLVAISSLAKRIEGITGAHYASGCWLETIDRCLAWWSGTGVRLVPKEPTAPSWSWASVSCGVVFVSNAGDEWTSELTLEGDMERHVNGRLRLRGAIWRLSFSDLELYPIDGEKYAYGPPNSYKRRLYWDGTPPEPYDKSGIMTLFKVGQNKTNSYAMLLQKTGRSMQGIEEYKRLGLFYTSLSMLGGFPLVGLTVVDLV